VHKPNLDLMWDTFVRLSWEDIPVGKHIARLRHDIAPLISRLKDQGVIDWYCFLIHDRRSGVPTTENDTNPYFHIRFALREGVDPDNLVGSLPKYCVMTRQIKHEWVDSILDVDKSLLKNGEIEGAWRIIGEQSELLLNLLSIYREDVEIPPQQIAQFLHFYANMTQLRVA